MEKAAAEATVPGTNGTAEPGSATAAAAVGTGATTEATGGGAVGAATPNDQISPEVYLGVVKSYNDRPALVSWRVQRPRHDMVAMSTCPRQRQHRLQQKLQA